MTTVLPEFELIEYLDHDPAVECEIARRCERPAESFVVCRTCHATAAACRECIRERRDWVEGMRSMAFLFGLEPAFVCRSCKTLGFSFDELFEIVPFGATS